MKDIWIEEKDYVDRTEFRVRAKLKYPKSLKRKGTYEEYLGSFETTGYGCGRFPFLFYAYKRDNWFLRFLTHDYISRRKYAIQQCKRVIKEHHNENNPTITKRFAQSLLCVL